MMGHNIKQLRVFLEMSQAELARVSGVPYFTILRLEDGTQKTTNAQYAVALARALHTTVERLIHEEASSNA